MNRKFILTEKPSVAKDFAAALNCFWNGRSYSNDEYEISNCIGHLFSLYDMEDYDPEFSDRTKFPIIPEKIFYKKNTNTIKQSDLIISILKKRNYNQIIIATDADREGEIIARECLFMAGINDLSKVRRFWVSQALTKDVILCGLRDAKPISWYDNLAAQGFGRQHADWLIGINCSRYMSFCAKKHLPVGRVQTAILAAIDSRCEAIRNFKSTEYFEYLGHFISGNGTEFTGCYYNEKKNFPENKFEGQLKSIEGKEAKVTDSQEELKISNAPSLYNLNNLQKDAYKNYKYTAEETLKTVQALYEVHKCVSYPRTPSVVMGSKNVELCNKIMDDLIKDYPQYSDRKNLMNITESNTRVFNDKKLDAHHALIPLKPLDSASEQEKNIYNLLLERFMLAFLPPNKFKVIKKTLSVNGNLFLVTARENIEMGWKSCNVATFPNSEEDTEEEQEINNVDWNSIILKKTECQKKWTKPPKFYNEASLLSFMENPKMETTDKKLTGLGTPATRHTFVPKLIKWGYIVSDGKSIVTTASGHSFIHAINKTPIHDLTEVNLTTTWEEKLENSPEVFIREIRTFISNKLNSKDEIKVEDNEPEITCPLCGKEIRSGKSNYYCIGYKNGCKFSIFSEIAGAKISLPDLKKLCSGKETARKKCVSKSGKEYECKFRYSKETNKLEFIF